MEPRFDPDPALPNQDKSKEEEFYPHTGILKEESIKETVTITIKGSSFNRTIVALRHCALCLGKRTSQAYEDIEQEFRQAKAIGQRTKVT